MDLTAELTALNLDCAQQEGVVAAVLPLHAEAEKLRAQAKLDALKIQALTLELAHLKRIRFGVKNEALSPEQRDLFRETLEVDGAAIAAETEQQVPALRAPRERAGRQPLPEHLPRIEHRHEPASCSCGECGGALVKIGEDISEQLDVTPATFFVHRHIRPQYACRPCERIVAAAIAPAVIDGGMAAPGLIAWVLISKYVDHLPLYRLEQIAARAGVTLARSTLADWVGRYGVALQPLADRLSTLLKQRCLLHADETPVQQLDPGQGKTKRAYLWASVAATSMTDRALPYLIIKPGAAVPMRVRFWMAGKAIWWSMTMPATKPCSRPALSKSAAWLMPGASFLSCIKPIRAQWRARLCSELASFTRLNAVVASWPTPSAKPCVSVRRYRNCRPCKSGCNARATPSPMAAAWPAPSTTA
jgi:transposase